MVKIGLEIMATETGSKNVFDSAIISSQKEAFSDSECISQAEESLPTEPVFSPKKKASRRSSLVESKPTSQTEDVDIDSKDKNPISRKLFSSFWNRKQTVEKTSQSPPKKAGPVHTKEELYHFVDLGLGRGLDGTDSAPWMNKTSFQVRQVTYDGIVGTEEGGTWQSYEREVLSVQTHQAQMKASLEVPHSPLTIGADAELSRSISTLRRTVGKIVKNRTISFRDDFEATKKENMTMGTFEERLKKWIMECYKHEHDVVGNFESPISFIESGIDRSDVKEACKEFVNLFRITHYVSAIELGAAEYHVLQEDEYHIATSASGSLGVEKVGTAASKYSYSSKKKRKASDVKSIGKIGADHTVQRGSLEEAVIGVKIQPITNLVKTMPLRKDLTEALLKFIEGQNNKSGKK